MTPASCGDCDGCGWVEGGRTLKTACSTCKGTGRERPAHRLVRVRISPALARASAAAGRRMMTKFRKAIAMEMKTKAKRSRPAMERQPTLQIEKAVNLQFYVVLRGANGERVAWTETYTRRADADRALRTWSDLMRVIQRNGRSAVVAARPKKG